MDKTTQAYQDVTELLQTGEPVVLAVDQVPFEVESRGVKNTFCLLVPLVTESGFDLRRSQFRNRERVWWMLRPDIDPSQILVGSVWSGPIERSRAYGNSEREKDHYQVKRTEIRTGCRYFVEVINLNVAHPDITDLLSPAGIPCPYPPLSRVIVRGGLSVLGPFSSKYNFETQRVNLRALDDDAPHVHRLTRAEFEARAEVREFSYISNQWDAKAQERQVDLCFVHEKDLALLQQQGEEIDGATDAQIVNWALGFLDVAEEGGQAFREVLDRARRLEKQAESDELKERLQRFLRLCEMRERVVGLGAEVASIVSGRDGFRELVEKHIESIAADRIRRAIEARSSEVESSTKQVEARLAEMTSRIADLENEESRRREAWEEQFRGQHGDRVRRLEERENELARQESEMRGRLQSMIDTFRDESDSFATRLLAELPLLQRLGVVLGGGSHAAPVGPPAGSTESRIETRAALDLPAFLSKPKTLKPHGESAQESEKRFLAEFTSVVQRHGFVFEEEDLANFHILVKTDLWTVLAGPSGLGKSSLPRLYAEALGGLDEFLLVPVRPDWLDDRDVIGAFNALSGRYEPAASGLVDHLIAADEDAKAGRGGIYIICLDEMNLARVEHYFAQFLSILELPEEDRCLKLFAHGTAAADDPYAPYRRLRIRRNVRFVGTVNVDETTHFFSPKVIDRVSIARIERPDLRQGLQSEDFEPPPARDESVHFDEYARWVVPPDPSDKSLDLILKADEILRRSRLGIGFRVRDRILSYISSARALLGEHRSVDFAVLQNILPALRPMAPRYMELIKDLQALFPEDHFRRTAQMLRAFEDDPESDFFQLL